MVKAPKRQIAKQAKDGGRLRQELVIRAEEFSDRALAVAERLQNDRRFNRFVEQLAASGTSVGANIAEASDAMSDKDFRKSLAIAKKELNETRFYFRICIRRAWVKPDQLDSLLSELEELRAIVGAILFKTDPARRRDTDTE